MISIQNFGFVAQRRNLPCKEALEFEEVTCIHLKSASSLSRVTVATVSESHLTARYCNRTQC